MQKISALPIFTASRDEGRLVYDSNEQKVFYGNADQWIEFESKDPVTSVIDIDTSYVSLDDSSNGDFGSLLGMYRTIDFGNRADNSCWFSFLVPQNWTTSDDIGFDLFYNLSGIDLSKNVNVTMNMWAVDDGDTPDFLTSDQTSVNTILSTTSNTGKLSIASLANIDKSNFTDSTRSIVIKLTRDISEDTYGGTLQLVKMTFAQ